MNFRNIGVSVVLCGFLAIGAIAQETSSQDVAANASSVARSSPEVVVPRLMKFSATLFDALGRPMEGPVGVTFAFYAQETGGPALWMETQNVHADGKGNYTVFLGAASKDGLPAEQFASGEARWLGVQAERQAEQQRVLLVSVPYALKAGDAQTLGGLPPSAFVQSQNNGSAVLLPATGTSAATAPAPTATPLAGTTSVTTPGLTSGTVPVADGASDIKNSHITDSGTTVTVAEPLTLQSTGTAVSGSTGGKTSQPLDLFGSTFNSTLSTAIVQHFRLQEAPVGQSTSVPSGKISLLYAAGAGVPAETGWSINSKGIMTFASGQTFPDPGDVKSVGLSAPATDFTVSGSPITSTGTLTFAWNVVPTSANTANAIVKRDASGSFSAGAGSFSGSLSSAAVVSGAAGSFVGNLAAGGSVSGSLGRFSGNVGIGTLSPNYMLEIIDPGNSGLRVQTNTVGGTVASFGGNGSFEIDAPGVVGGRFVVDEFGDVLMSRPGAQLKVGGNFSVDQFGNVSMNHPGAVLGFPDGTAQSSGSIWAVVNSNGVLVRSHSATASSVLATGQYEVDFARDVSACAYVATPFIAGPAFVAVVPRNGVPNGLFVSTFDKTGASSNVAFQVAVFC
jgi:hypothetical protein